MVAITPAILTSLSILGMVQSVIANSATEADSLAVVRGISDTLSEEVYHDKRATGKLPKPIRKAGQAAIKVASKLPGKKHLKAAAGGAEKKVVKASIGASKIKSSIKKKLGKKDLESGDIEILVSRDAIPDLIARSVAENWDSEIYYDKRATGKLPKPIRKAGLAAIKVGSKLPGKKHIKAAVSGATNKAVKASIGASKVKNSIKKKLGGKRDLGEDYDVEVRDFDDEVSWE